MDNQVVKLDVTEQKLAELRSKYAQENWPDITTKAGYEFFRKGVAELRGLRTGTETFRKQATKPLRDKVAEINDKCKEVTEHLFEIEDPMKEVKQEHDAKIKAEKEEEERKRLARVAEITERINKIRDMPLKLISATPDEIQKAIDDLMMVDPESHFEEFTDTAIETISSTLKSLRELHQKAMDSEEAEKRRQEEEAKQAEAEKAKQEQYEKDMAELEMLRKKNSEKAKEEPQEDQTEMREESDGELLDSLAKEQKYLDDRKQMAIDDLTGHVERAYLANLNASGLAEIIFKAIYASQVRYIKFDFHADTD